MNCLPLGFIGGLGMKAGAHMTEQVPERGLRCCIRCWSCSFSAVNAATCSSSFFSSTDHF